MSLRTRLIIAFLCLSVVPLSAITLFWYASTVNAFERAAEREATQSAAEIGRRMELITSALGRRVDRMFEDADENPDPDIAVDADRLQAKVAPLLGDAAMLVDRVEFHPALPAASFGPSGSELLPPAPPPPAPAGTRGASPPKPPKPPKVIVVDVPKMIEQARRAARARTDSAAASAALAQLGPVIESALAASAPAVEASFAAIAEAASREANSASGKKIEMQVSGPKIEVAVKKHGKMVGKANAIMNLDHTLRPVLALARRDQGEIAFAIDQAGTVFTPDPAQKATLDGLKIKDAAAAASNGDPRRVGDWIVVARKDPTGLLFGIARPIAESLKEIRRTSWRNLSIGLGVIALACIGIVPISHRMTQHVSSLSAGVRQLADGDFKARVPVRSKDEFGALAVAFNTMAADLERNQALVVERERLRRELELSRLIQTEMLPRAPLRLGAAEIKGVSIPAREVGGDFFNYFALPDGRLALLVGDVSGKGVSAALLMANVQA
jgi:HAMP domain-containing protein